MEALDVFSCVGCHTVGLAAAGIDTVAFVEKNDYRRSVLAMNFPEVPVYEDIKTYDPASHPARIIIGGPPCQKTSVSAAIHGKRNGESLWSEMLRVGAAMAVEWFVVEQPPGNKAWEAEVSDGLYQHGYHAARIEFAASDCGAPYLRRRVYILACSSLSRLEIAWLAIPQEIERAKRAANARGYWSADQLATLRVDAMSAGEVDRPMSRKRIERIEALGDSNPPIMVEVVGRALMLAHNPFNKRPKD